MPIEEGRYHGQFPRTDFAKGYLVGYTTSLWWIPVVTRENKYFAELLAERSKVEREAGVAPVLFAPSLAQLRKRINANDSKRPMGSGQPVMPKPRMSQ